MAVYDQTGYTQIRMDEGARRKTYETVMIEIHEKAAEIADSLELELQPAFRVGPLPDVLQRFFSKRGLELKTAKAEQA